MLYSELKLFRRLVRRQTFLSAPFKIKLLDSDTKTMPVAHRNPLVTRSLHTIHRKSYANIFDLDIHVKLLRSVKYQRNP